MTSPPFLFFSLALASLLVLVSTRLSPVPYGPEGKPERQTCSPFTPLDHPVRRSEQVGSNTDKALVVGFSMRELVSRCPPPGPSVGGAFASSGAWCSSFSLAGIIFAINFGGMSRGLGSSPGICSARHIEQFSPICSPVSSLRAFRHFTIHSKWK